MAMEWLRWYHGACSDPKWAAIARKSRTNVGTVVAIWAAMLEYASQQPERGSLRSFDAETVDAMYGYDDGTCAAVISAMESKNIIVDGHISAWGKRQRESDNSTARVQKYRENKKNARSETAQHEEAEEQQQNMSNETQCNADETLQSVSCNANETQNCDETHQNTDNRLQSTEYREYIQDAVGNKGGMGGEEPNPASGGGSGEQKQLLTDHTPEEQEVLSLFEGVHDLKQPDSGKLVKQYRTLKADFPSVDILSEVKKMALWLENRDKKNNAKANVLLFMRNWVERASKTPSPSMSDLQRYKNGPPQSNADGSIGKADEGNEERNRRLAEKYMKQFEGMM